MFACNFLNFNRKFASNLQNKIILQETMKKILDPSKEITWIHNGGVGIIHSKDFEKDGIKALLFPAVEDSNTFIDLYKDEESLSCEIGASWLVNWKSIKLTRKKD